MNISCQDCNRNFEPHQMSLRKPKKCMLCERIYNSERHKARAAESRSHPNDIEIGSVRICWSEKHGAWINPIACLSRRRQVFINDADRARYIASKIHLAIAGVLP